MPQEPAPEFDHEDTDHTGREDSTMIAAKAKVWFFDDDATPEDFVMYALEQFFGLDEAKARSAVERIRKQGKAVVVEMPAIPAELAKRRVQEAASDAGYPFKVEIEGTQIV
jgi:ATP-dependent Clp protease adapter protein ClpS